MMLKILGGSSVEGVVVACELRFGRVLQSLWRRDLFMGSAELVPRCYVKSVWGSVAESQSRVASDLDAPSDRLRAEVNYATHRK